MDNACTTRGLSTFYTANSVHTNMYGTPFEQAMHHGLYIKLKFQCMEIANGYTNKIDCKALLRMSVNTW